MSEIEPFANEVDPITIGDFTIENRVNRISHYGSLQITRDQEGLRLARELKDLIDATVAVLEADANLPEHVQYAPVKKIRNPFGS